MNFDSFLERVVASTVSGLIVSVVVLLIVERALKTEETPVASVASIQRPMVYESIPRW